MVTAALGVLFLLPVRHAAAIPPALTKAVPQDIVAAFFVSGSDSAASLPAASKSPTAEASNEAPSTLQLAAFLTDQAQQLGLLSQVDAHCRAWIDGLAVVSIAFQHPHAIVLLDIRATPRTDGGHELAGLRKNIDGLMRPDHPLT